MLHCLAFPSSIQGGLSVFWDGFALAEELQQKNPEAFLALATLYQGYYKEDALNRQTYRRPIIRLESPIRDLSEVPSARVIGLNLSPPWELPADLPPADVSRYYRARHALNELLHSDRFKVVFRLQEGDMVAFNNRRVLHGRSAFTDPVGGQKRHLQGAYVDTDNFSNVWRTLQRSLNATDAVFPPAGNYSH